ncbi:MAG: FecR domain-containing protein [Cyclobacteriaceae bacterium]|nr:FecR domain-containing protein [Cyclobacteriaceae bacterium]
MDHTTHNIDELIGKYLAGEATETESAHVQTWLQKSEANQQYFNQLKTIFERAATVTEWQHFDEDTAWQKLKSRLANNGGKTIALPPRNASSGWWRIAASIIAVFVFGLLAYRVLYPGQKNMQVITSTQTASDTLPEGSKVYLNKETKLAYTYEKQKKVHRVKLEGEAYFSIHHDATKTFVVEAEGVYIRDIGTSFNVKAYPESTTIEVIVEEGEVMFYSENDSGILLRANGKGIYDKVTKKFTVDRPESNVLAYKTKFFVFSDSDLGTVIAELNRVYDKQIVLPDPLKKCRLTVTFNNENLDEIVQVIAETFDLTVKASGDKLILEGKGCELP